MTSAFGGEDGASADLDQILDGVTDGQVATNAQMRTRGQIDEVVEPKLKWVLYLLKGKVDPLLLGGSKTVAPKVTLLLKN